MADDKRDADVIDLSKRIDERAFVETRGSSRDRCAHRQIVLDVEHRVVECQRCEAQLDLFDWTVMHTEAYRRAYDQLGFVRREIRVLSNERSDLARQVRNLKAQVARAEARIKRLGRA